VQIRTEGKKTPKPPAPKGEYSIHPALSRKNLDVPKEVDPPSKLARGELYKPYAVAPGPASKRGGLQTVCHFRLLLKWLESYRNFRLYSSLLKKLKKVTDSCPGSPFRGRRGLALKGCYTTSSSCPRTPLASGELYKPSAYFAFFYNG